MTRVLAALLAAAVLGAGVGVGGWFVGAGFKEGRATARFVTVKGLSERQVAADYAIWPLRMLATGNDLTEVQAEIEASEATVRAFLGEQGFTAGEISVEGFEVIDQLAQAYRSGPVESRFILSRRLMVRTNDVAKVEAANRAASALAGRGVVLSNESHGLAGPFFIFTGLNDIKPDMIAEATRNARKSADEFAADSGSRVGGIRRANQGQFQILPRDNAPGLYESQQIAKSLRVVSTVEFLLED